MNVYSRVTEKLKELEKMGRILLYPTQITLTMTAEMKDAIDSALDIEAKETRLDFVRAAIEVKLAGRRAKAKTKRRA